MFNKRFILNTIEKAIKTAAQTTLASGIGVSVNFFTLDAKQIIGLMLGTATFSLLTSLAQLNFTQPVSDPSVPAGITGATINKTP